MKIGFYNGDRTELFSDAFDESKIEKLLDAETAVPIGLVFSLNGKTYCVCAINYKHDFARAEEIEIGEGEDKDYESFITCPYCGDKESDSWEAGDFEDEEICSVCGGVFSYKRNVEVTYSSCPVKAPEIKRF